MKIRKQCTFGRKSVKVWSFDNVIGSPNEALFSLVDGFEVFSIASERSQIVLIGHDDNQVWLMFKKVVIEKLR